MNIEITPYARKHGIDDEDILRAWHHHLVFFEEGEDPLKVIRLGFDYHRRLLEVGGNIYPDGRVRIFHAMKARPKYTRRI